MRKILCVIMIAIMLVLGGSMAGCSKKVKAGKPYRLYSYDAGKGSFIELGSTLTFGKDLSTFERSYADGSYTIFGSVQHLTAPDAYIISCNPEISDAVSGLPDMVVSRDQLYASGEYLFSVTAIELYHVPDGKSADVDGYYYYKGSSDSDDSMSMLYFSNGNMYEKTDQGEYNSKVGYYTVNHDILTLTSVDKNGKDAYKDGVLLRKKYLLAHVTLAQGDDPAGISDPSLFEKCLFLTGIYAEKSAYSGKTIVVLADEFFAVDFS